jgi:glycosyltransferase involved in cell wall biosynthesis
VKLVVQTHGMLDEWALDQSRLKKMIALHFYQKRDLTRADLLVTTCTHELESLRTFGLRNPVAVIPNGIERLGPRSFDVIGGSGRLRTALFLSRLHPKKGLEDLLIAWSLIRPKGWRIKVVGDGNPEYVKRIRGLIATKGLADEVFLEGACYGEERYRYYEEADLFILPSYGENFGLVVLEALAHGLPVLTTNRTPWGVLAETGSGWIVEPGVKSVLGGLKIALALGDEQHKSIRVSARRLAEQYSWQSSAEKLFEVYQWLLNGGRIPATVSTG